ncbi:MAG: ATP-dependent Clp protease proteolytic subunit [Phycisphaerae bacterium]|nr:ATP-dependent Clp protease proteolytic subunit [Phycisphaerae bacterium]
MACALLWVTTGCFALSLALTATAQPAAPTPVPVASRAGFDRAIIIPITKEINDVTLESLKRRVEAARTDDVDLIVFELNTPGGVATTALEICTLIKNIGDIHTVAWVNPDAYSAGAIIALACDEIVMNARSKIGDCQPIMIGPQGVTAVPEEIEAKVTSPLIEELEDSANRNGYDLNLCLAMIRPDMELFWIENTKTGERLFVNADRRNRLFGIEDGRSDRGRDTSEADGADTNADDGEDRPSSRRDRRGGDVEPIPDERSTTDWRYVKQAPPLPQVRQPVVSGDQLLTMGQDAAIAFGFAKAKVSSDSELRTFFGVRGPMDRLAYTLTEKIVAWLSSPMVRSVLFILMLLAAYVEFNTPGVGVPGIVALVCLLIFLGAPYLTGLADAWEILVVICGVGLLLVEAFVIPGFGITGIAGALLILIGLLATFMPDDPGPIYLPTFDYTLQGAKTGLWVIAGSLSGSIVGMIALSRVLPRSPYFRRIVPANPTPESIAVKDPYPEVARIGDVGRAEGPLRPAGKARFGSTLVDVVSDGEFVGSGDPIEVMDRQGNRIVVRRVRGRG